VSTGAAPTNHANVLLSGAAIVAGLLAL